MKSIKKSTIISFVVVTAVFVALLLVATFYDLQISQKLAVLKDGNYYSTSLFGRFFETVGETSVYILSVFAGAIIFHNAYRRKRSVFSIIFMILGLSAALGLATYMVSVIFKYTSQHFGFEHLLGGVVDYICYFILGAAFTLLVFYLLRKVPSAFLNKMIVWAFVFFATILVSRICVTLLKNYAGRPRYRAMYVLNDFTLFKKWYEFQPKPAIPADWENLLGATKDWFKSFPSGHASACSSIITIVAIPSLFKRTDNFKFKFIFAFVAVTITLLVMLSRIVVGAHFLSDVLFGTYINFFWFIIFNTISKPIANKINLSPLPENSKPILVEEVC